MRNPQGNATIVGDLQRGTPTIVEGGVRHHEAEIDTYTCFHCCRIVHVPVRADPANIGGLCKQCMGLVCSRCYAKGIRDRAILRLLHDLALRRGEVVGLDAKDLDLEAGTVAVLGKGRTGKVNLSLPEPTREALFRPCSVLTTPSTAIRNGKH